MQKTFSQPDFANTARQEDRRMKLTYERVATEHATGTGRVDFYGQFDDSGSLDEIEFFPTEENHAVVLSGREMRQPYPEEYDDIDD